MLAQCSYTESQTGVQQDRTRPSNFKAEAMAWCGLSDSLSALGCCGNTWAQGPRGNQGPLRNVPLFSSAEYTFKTCLTPGPVLKAGLCGAAKRWAAPGPAARRACWRWPHAPA